MGDLNNVTNQNVTNPVITLVRKKEGRQLDNIREDYVSLMEEAAKLEAKGKTAKAEEKRQLAAGAEAKYAETAKAMGLQADLKSTLARESAPLVKEGVVLTKAQKEKIKDIEKELKDLRKTLDDYTQEQLLEIERTGTTNLSAKKIQKAKEAMLKEEQLSESYANKRAEYGIPSQQEIVKKLYSIEDPVKAKELRNQIKEELKAANMWFGNTEDFVKSDNFKAISQAREVKNQFAAHERNGYAAVRKSVYKTFDERVDSEGNKVVTDGADVIRMLDGNAGSEGVMNIGLEKNTAKYGINVTHYEEDFIADNKAKSFAEVDTIYLSGRSIKTSDIERVTLLSGETLTKGQFENIPLGLVRSVETDIAANKQYSFGAVVKEKGDDGYASRKIALKAYKDLGGKTEKLNVAKAALDAVGMGALAASPNVVAPFEVRFNSRFFIDVTSNDVIESEYVEKWLNKIREQLDSHGVITEIEGVTGFTYEDIHKKVSKHYCVAPAVIAAATAFANNLVKQAIDGNEKDAAIEAYRAAREKLSLELIHNARGADGQSKLNPDELNVTLANALVDFDKVVKTIFEETPEKTQETPVTQEPQGPKVLQLETRETAPKLEQDAQYCTYTNKAGEYWSGIVANTYKDANGQVISGSDLTELWKHIKYEVNKYGKNDAGMPKGVKMVKTYTCKSGKTYTYDCGEPKTRIISKEKDKQGRSTNFGNPRVDMTNGFQQKWSDPSFGYTITENGNVIYDSGNYEGSRVAAGKADLQNDKKYYEDKGYIFK